MKHTLESWGLGSLANELRKLILKGDTAPDTLALALSQTQAYKQRFAGNEIRMKNGLPELTPAQYIATEEQYQNVLRAYGLPPGFYDKHADFVKLIGNDVSPTELDTRAKIAHDYYTSAPAAEKALWQQYGFAKGDVIAGILDPKVATQVIQDRANMVALGGAAAQEGFALSKGRARLFNQNGVTLQQAQQAYSQIAQTFGTDQSIAQRFGATFGQKQEEDDLLLGKGSATNLRDRLYSEETALFKGTAGVDQNTLSVSQDY